MEVILRLAEQLGGQLARHPVTVSFLARQKELKEDTSAQELLDRFEKQAQKMARLESEGKPIEPEDKRLLTDLQTQVSSHDTVKRYLAEQVNYMHLLRQVNNAVMRRIRPEESTPPAGEEGTN